MASSKLQTKGTLKVVKSKGGRPTHVGLILQQLPTGGIVNCIVPMRIYKSLEEEVIKYHSGNIKHKELCLFIMDTLQKHRSEGGIIEAYNTLDTTTTDLRKYRILEILTLPAMCGPVGLVPGLTLGNTYKFAIATGEMRLVDSKLSVNDIAKNHINPDRRETKDV